MLFGKYGEFIEMIEWLEQNKEWLFSGAGVTIVVAVCTFIIKKIGKKKDRNFRGIVLKSNKKKDIHICITGSDNDNPFSLDSKKSTPIDFVSWNIKMESGGHIYFIFDYVSEMKKYLNKKNLSENERKEIYDGIRRVEDTGKIMELMIKKALLEKSISCKIQNFPLFVESTINKCFLFIRHTKSYSKTLEVYNNKESFKFEISDEEYDNVFKKSKGRIEISHFIYFSEFMSYVTDKSILEREIIPIYLKINAIKETSERKEIAIKDFYNWWISIG